VRLRLLSGELALCRLDPGAVVPPYGGGAAFWSLTRTPTETSLICPAADAPEDATVVPGYRALEVEGPLDLAMTGVMAALASPLADAGVPILPVATHDTDYVLVPGPQIHHALAALRDAGHDVSENAQPEK
jgi:hypothetical protein